MTRGIPLSILVPSFNPGGYLMTAVESVAGQLVDGDEVLLQDGGSTDGSLLELTRRYSGAPWLKTVSESDSGQSDALQRALDRAVNDYVMWLNADDIIYPNALSAVRRGLAGGPDVLCGRSTIFTNDGRIVRTYTPGAVTRRALVGRGSNLFTGSLALRTDLVRSVGGFDADFEYCMDLDLIMRLAESNPIVDYIPAVVGGLRWHAESKGGSTICPIVREATQIRLAHARGSRERAIAAGASFAYFLACLAQPLRHSPAYSRLRARMSAAIAPDGEVTI